jgi:hypothetical protein
MAADVNADFFNGGHNFPDQIQHSLSAVRQTVEKIDLLDRSQDRWPWDQTLLTGFAKLPQSHAASSRRRYAD